MEMKTEKLSFRARLARKITSNLKLKGKIILSIVTVEFLIFSTSSAISTYIVANDTKKLTSEVILNAFHNNANKIRQMSGEMIQDALVLAQTGQLLYNLKKRHRNMDVAEVSKEYVVLNFQDIPTAIGGGLWYEPYIIEPGQKYMGPYAYWEDGKVRFTWDLNTPKYDYLNQDWYTIALPKNWNRRKKRKRKHYWTPPYFDEAGTNALMITVDAFIYDKNGKIIGLSTVDWALGAMQKFLRQFKYTENSFAFLIDKASKQILYHPDRKLWIKKYTVLGWGKHLDFGAPKDQIKELKDISINGENYDIIYSNLNDDFIFGLAVNKDEAYAMIPWMIARNVLLLVLTLGSIATVLYLTINALTHPLKNLTDVVHRFAQKDFSVRADVHTTDEVGELADTFNSMADAIQDYSQSMENKVEERTRDLNKSLETITKLKFLQDGDYFLTSQLLKPLSGNYAKSDLVRIEYIVEQKKRFKFKKWEEEIGGDVCSTHSIQLQDKSYTLFLNADAMGKSLQGASGILVMGSIFNAALDRLRHTKALQRQSPERWLKNTFIELQNVFETFDGSMYLSIIIGLVDDDTGALYFINAEHPDMVLFKKGEAEFLQGHSLRKVGMMGLSGKLYVNCKQLHPTDVLLLGSDGRDDILLGYHEDGSRNINEEETLFLEHVAKAKGDLQKIAEYIKSTGEITDDLSLMKIEYLGNPSLQESPETLQALRKAKDAVKNGENHIAIEILETALQKQPQAPRVLKSLVNLYNTKQSYKKAADYAGQYLSVRPADTEFLQTVSVVFLKAGKNKEAIEIAERLRLRRPDLKKNLHNLAIMQEQAGNKQRAKQIRRELAALQ